MKLSPSMKPGFHHDSASVLLVTLGFVLLITVITMAFLVRSRNSLQTSQSYTKEIVAQQIGEIAIDKLAAEFQKEAIMGSTNSPPILLPPRIGVAELDPRKSALVRRTSGDTNAYNTAYQAAGFAAPPHSNRSSAISTDIPAKNGWRFDKNRWEAPGLLRMDGASLQAFTAPDWVYVYGQAKSNASAADDKSSDIIGRFAAMVYDVGGLLDINEAGVPGAVSIRDKGSVAFADLSAVFGTPSGADALVNWRNPSVTADNIYGLPTETDPTKAGNLEAPVPKLASGNNRFFSRMELVEAAKAGRLGLSPYLLPDLRTRSVAANRVGVEDVFGYGTNVLLKLNDPLLAASHDTVVSVTRIDGSTESVTIRAKAPLFQRRFPLARLRWLADRQPDGTPKHQAEIKKYFGLTWDAPNKIFFYTSPDANVATAGIRTLADLASAINSGAVSPAREPDFFEWLKAAINPDSLGQTGGSTDREFLSAPNGTADVPWEKSKDLHVLRIGANIIDQADPDSIPTGIRSEFSGVEPAPFDSFGQENLPALNEAITSVYRPDATRVNGYLQFELWNPNRNAYTGKVPKGYDGNAITGIRVGSVGGRAIMEPYVYVPAEQNYSLTPDAGREINNKTYQCYKKVAEYSTDPLTTANFNSPDLKNRFITIPFNGSTYGAATGFFDEPFLANRNKPFGQDSDNPAKSGDLATNPGGGARIYLGETPSDGDNGILLCSVTVPNIAFSGIPLAKAVVGGPGIYAKATTSTPATGSVAPTTNPSGDKGYNAVQFNSCSQIAYSIPTSPITIQIEVESGGRWIPVNRYHNLAFEIESASPLIGSRVKGVISGPFNEQKEANWTANSTTSYFSDWQTVSNRKGYPMTDPRTERFGLTDQNVATPGQGIYPVAGVAFIDGYADSNRACGTVAAVGKAITSPWNIANPAVTSPLNWILCKPGAISVSVPAYLAWNNWSKGTTDNHAYKDYDAVSRPADARWAPETSHPALPPASAGAAQDPNVLATRPAILDRPFRNVAELGYSFRDVPWKSLDLFSPDSADRRLLDVFSIEDRATVSGKINPNSAGENTLKAILHGTSLDPSDTSVVADAAADAVAVSLAAAPAISGGEKLAARLGNSTLSPDSAPKTGDTVLSYKTKGENFLRALSSTTDTRDWQLLLDVVAQAGRVTPKGSFTDFVVEGQRRFFVHLTVDRFTGEIVDKQIEPVYE